MKTLIMQIIAIAKVLQGETVCVMCPNHVGMKCSQDSFMNCLRRMGIEHCFVYSPDKISRIGDNGQILFMSCDE